MPLSRLLEIQGNNLEQPCTSFGIHENLPVLQNLYNQGKVNFIANGKISAKLALLPNHCSFSNILMPLLFSRSSC